MKSVFLMFVGLWVGAGLAWGQAARVEGSVIAVNSTCADHSCPLYDVVLEVPELVGGKRSERINGEWERLADSLRGWFVEVCESGYSSSRDVYAFEESRLKGGYEVVAFDGRYLEVRCFFEWYFPDDKGEEALGLERVYGWDVKRGKWRGVASSR